MTAKQLAGYRNQKNGHKFEILVWHIVKRRRGCIEAIISSGSKGMFDVVGVGKIKTWAVICKRNGYLTPKEREIYIKFMQNKPEYIQVEFWFRISPRKHKKVIIKNVDFFKNW